MNKLIILLSSTLSLSGCATLVPKPGEPPKRFTLAAVDERREGKITSIRIVVDLPKVYPPLDNQRVAVVPGQNLIDYYADCEWGERLSVLIQDSLVYSLQNSKIYGGVSRSSNSIQGDYLLKTDVRAFYIQQKPQLQAVTGYFVQLVRLSDRQVISSKMFESKFPLRNETLEEINFGLNNSNIETEKDIILWLYKIKN